MRLFLLALATIPFSFHPPDPQYISVEWDGGNIKSTSMYVSSVLPENGQLFDCDPVTGTADVRVRGLFNSFITANGQQSSGWMVITTYVLQVKSITHDVHELPNFTRLRGISIPAGQPFESDDAWNKDETEALSCDFYDVTGSNTNTAELNEVFQGSGTVSHFHGFSVE